MRTRTTETKTQAIVQIVVLAAVLVVANLLSQAFFGRADLTARKEYTVSDSTRRVLADLPDIVNITVYMSEDLPQHMTGLRTRVEDLLDEYRAFGGERVRVSFVDPASDPELLRRVRALGIPPVQLQALERDRAEVVNAYLGIGVMYEDRTEVMPVVLGTERLEYNLSSAILKVTATTLPTVGFTAGHGERAVDGSYSGVAAELRKSYHTAEVDLTAGGVPDSVTTLVVAGPDRMLDTELYEIDQFIMRGGSALFLLDGAIMSPESFSATPSTSNVLEFAAVYGAEIESDLVVDALNSNASFHSGFMALTMPYHYWPRAADLSRENPVVAGLDAVTFPWTSSITLSEDAPDGVLVEPLARSSGRSWSVPATSSLDPRQAFAPPPDVAEDVIEGRAPGIVLAAALSGPFRSAFAEKPVIVDNDGDPEFTRPPDIIRHGQPSRIIMIGNSRMFENTLLRQFPSNAVLFLNAIDWLALGESLIGVRSKAVVDRPLAEVGDRERATMKFLATFGVPIVLVAFGLGRTMTKSRRREASGDRLMRTG